MVWLTELFPAPFLLLSTVAIYKYQRNHWEYLGIISNNSISNRYHMNGVSFECLPGFSYQIVPPFTAITTRIWLPIPNCFPNQPPVNIIPYVHLPVNVFKGWLEKSSNNSPYRFCRTHIGDVFESQGPCNQYPRRLGRGRCHCSHRTHLPFSRNFQEAICCLVNLKCLIAANMKEPAVKKTRRFIKKAAPLKFTILNLDGTVFFDLK